MKQHLQLLFLSLITFLGLILRLYNVDKIPRGFFCDEAATGYNAYTILKRGVDEYGKSFPLLFNSFGNNRLPLPIYMTVPFIAIFGLNEFSTRLASVFFGTVTISIIYFLLKNTFPKRKSIGFFGAFFLAIAPWHIHFSRTALESIYLPFFISLGLLLFVLFARRKKPIFLYLSFTGLALGLYTYYPAYLVVPSTILLVSVLYIKKLLKFKKHFVLSLIAFFVVAAPLIRAFFDGRALTRWNDGVSIFSKYKTPQEITSKVLYTYKAHFSPDFLFKLGDIDFPGQFILRHSVKGMGMLYWYELPLIVVALAYILIKRRKAGLLLLGILLMYPIGTTVTSSTNPFATRSIMGSIIWPMISALGASILLEITGKYKAIYLSFLAIAVSLFLSRYLYLYHYEYPLYSSGYLGWQAGPRQIMQIFLRNKDNYDDLIMVGSLNAPNIFLNFYDPDNECKWRCKISINFDSYDPKKRQLYAIGSDKIYEAPSSLTFVQKEMIYYPNKTPAFYIGEFEPNSLIRKILPSR